jgi:hypothetical protein
MGYQKLPIQKVYVRFDAAESVIQRVEQRMSMHVVIVGVDIRQWLRLRSKAERSQA